MQFVITKQIAVEAETPEEAVQKISEGSTISLNVSLRPQAGIVQGQTVRGQTSVGSQPSK